MATSSAHVALPNSPSVIPLAPVSVGSSSLSGKSRSPSVKPPNVFSNDGSFLDRVRRSLKEEDEKKKAQEAIERKKKFEDRFKQRGKRRFSKPEPLQDSSHDAEQESTSDANTTPQKKRKLSDGEPGGNNLKESNVDDEEKTKKESHSPQAEYHKAVDSYPSNLKDSGNGVRPLVK